MDDRDTDASDTATFDLSRAEAREVIAALSDAEMTASGDRQRHYRNVASHLAAEFDFDEYRGPEKGEMAAGDDEGWIDNDAIFGSDDEDDEETIELSRREADEVTDALARHEPAADENAGQVEDVRRRIADAFGE